MATRVPLRPGKDAMSYAIARMRFTWLLLLLTLVGRASVHAQDPRDAMVARAFNEFDAARRLQLLMSALNPTAGPPRGAWPVGVQLLAQTLIEDGQDSVAGVWLRWAVRLSPDLQPDTVQFLPKVVAAYRSARDFVLSTRAPTDTAAATTWLWPAPDTRERTGRLQIAGSNLAAPLRIDVRGVGPIGPGGSVPLNPGSYQISAAAAGRDDGARVPPPLGARAGGADQAGGAREDHAGARCRAAAEEEGIPGGMGGARGRGRSRALRDPLWRESPIRTGQHHGHVPA